MATTSQLGTPIRMRPAGSTDGPAPVRTKTVHFFDWRYVSPGGFRWVDLQGHPLPGTAAWNPSSALWLPAHFPFGIRLVPQSAVKGDPLDLGGDPWAAVLWHGTVRYEDGRYRLWYETISPEQRARHMGGTAAAGPGAAHPASGGNATPAGPWWLPEQLKFLCYAESDDGVTWKAPRLPFHPYGDAAWTNIVYGGRLCQTNGFHGSTVFKDVAAPESERYKAFYAGAIRGGTLDTYLQSRPDAVDPYAWREEGHAATALMGAVSPDGLQWTALSDPLLVQMADTQNVCEYDAARGEYVAYVRAWRDGRRAIGRTATEDFRRWPPPRLVMSSDDRLGPSAQWYASAKTTYPGASDVHLMFPLEWRIAEDRYYPHFATSVDNDHWTPLPGDPVLSPGPEGAWDAGGAWIGPGLVPLPGDRIGALFAGWRIPHKYPRAAPFVSLAWAWWPKGRLVALEAAEWGEFATRALLIEGRRIRLNVCTGPTGYVLVELVGQDGRPLPGRSLAESTPVRGDHLSVPVSWGSETTLGHTPSIPVRLRFRMYAAQLFGLEFE